MRAYFFGNFYLSPIQQGIQAAHCLAEMFIKYRQPSPQHQMLENWAIDHKTIILLNGGNSSDLHTIATIIHHQKHHLSSALPWSVFSEDKQSLNSALTCVGIIVNSKMISYMESCRLYNGIDVSYERLARDLQLIQSEVAIADLIRSKSLAH